MSVSFPYHEQPEGLRLDPCLGLDDDQERELRNCAWGQIVTGVDDVDDFCEIAEDDFDLDEKVLVQAFDQMLRARRAQQEAWPSEVRETALTRAFADLAEIGVVARQAFSCCGNCGSGEIYGERDDSRVWRGYVFFHSQDADGIVESRQTYIGYGAFLEHIFSEDEWNALSDPVKDETYRRLVTDLMRDEVVPVLERHGIEVEWDGDLGRRILLKGVDWYADVRDHPRRPAAPAQSSGMQPRGDRPLGDRALRLETSDGQVLDDPSEAGLMSMMNQVAQEPDGFLIVTDPADPAGMTYMQACPVEPGGVEKKWTVEYQDGSLTEHWQTDPLTLVQAHRVIARYLSDRSWQDSAEWSRMAL